MAKKEFMFKGKTTDEIKSLTIEEFLPLIPSRQRRSLKRGLTDQHKRVLEKVKKGDKNIKTHCRDLVILPEMIDVSLKIYNGKEFQTITITPEMVGHFLGEFALTRKRVSHSAPGVGATRSSASISVR